MIFELLYRKIINWLHRKSTCEHDWVKYNSAYSLWGSGYYRKVDSFKCKKCKKKEKRPDEDARDFIML